MQKISCKKTDDSIKGYKFFKDSKDFKEVFSYTNSYYNKFLNNFYYLTYIISIVCWMLLTIPFVISIIQFIFYDMQTIWSKNINILTIILFSALFSSIIAIVIASELQYKRIKLKNKYLPMVRDSDFLSLDDKNIDKYFFDELPLDKLKQFKEIADINLKFKSLLNKIMTDRNDKILMIDYILLGGENFIKLGEKEKKIAADRKKFENIKNEIKGLNK